MPYEIEENITIYEKVIQDLCLLYEHIGIGDNPIQIYESFRYMYLNHYLSCEEFSDEIPRDFINLELKGYLPMDIVGSMILANYGVCRHTTDFLSHIYSCFDYDNSSLFTYHPTLHIEVMNHGNQFLTNYHAQKYIDQALEGFDLFSKKEIHDSKRMDTIEIKIDYLASVEKLNHVMNIVKSKRYEKRVHILDTRNHAVGEKIDSHMIRLNHLGLTHTDFVQKECPFFTYYGTSYHRGRHLLHAYDTDMKSDLLQSTIYQEPKERDIEVFQSFKKDHQKQLNRVSENFKQLIKKTKL